MNEEQKKRYEQLKKNNQSVVEKREWKSNILLQEALASLGTKKEILETRDQKELLAEFNRKVKILFEKEDLERRNISSVEEFSSGLDECNVYIIWDEYSLPVVKTKLINIKKNLDDIVAVSFDTWIVTETFDRFIEFNHNGKITEILTDAVLKD